MAQFSNTMLPPRQKSLLYIIFAVSARLELGSSFLGSAVFDANIYHLPARSAKSAKHHLLGSTRTFSPRLSASTTAEDAPPRLVPPGILGPPEPLRSLEVGRRVDAFRAPSLGEENDEQRKGPHRFTIERVAREPDAFLLRNFVTASECDAIRSAAVASGMEGAGTVTEGDSSSRKNCTVAWLPSNDAANGLVVAGDLVASTMANAFLSRDVLSHPSAGVEDLQVLRYGAVGGEFVHHHDGEARVLTVIYYLNGVGGTWFPLARTDGDDDEASRDVVVPVNKARALEMTRGLRPGRDGLLVEGAGRAGRGKDSNENDAMEGGENDDRHIARIDPGDAIAFYNYEDDGSARVDWRALHCGLPTTEEEGTKWIANHWYRVNVLAEL